MEKKMKEEPAAKSERVYRVIVLTTKDMYKRLKYHSIDECRSVSDICREALEKYFAKTKKEAHV
jgi:predicted DNA-binding protein